MGEHRRKADGRRVFSTEFKRETVQRIVTGEKTVAELSRELDIAPSVIRNWKRFAESGATTAVQANEDVVPTSQLREAYAKIRELERALGRKTMEVEILRMAQEIVTLLQGRHHQGLSREELHEGRRADRPRAGGDGAAGSAPVVARPRSKVWPSAAAVTRKSGLTSATAASMAASSASSSRPGSWWNATRCRAPTRRAKASAWCTVL